MWYIYIYIYIYTNLPVNAIVRLHHPRSGYIYIYIYIYIIYIIYYIYVIYIIYISIFIYICKIYLYNICTLDMYNLYYIYLLSYTYIYILYTWVTDNQLFMYAWFSFCMLQCTKLLERHWITSTKRIFGSDNFVEDKSESVCL